MVRKIMLNTKILPVQANKKLMHMPREKRGQFVCSLPTRVDVKGDVVHKDKGWAFSSQSSLRVLGCRS